MSVLEVRGIRSGYADTTVLHGVDLDVGEQEVVCLVGRNGVGKTTLLRTVMGMNTALSGEVRLCGETLDGSAPYEIARRGVSYAAQEGGLFTALTVRENLVVAASTAEDLDARLAGLRELFPRLTERMGQKAGTLSGGEQRMLLTARALLGRPRLVLLDEITEGMQPSLVPRVGEAIALVRERDGASILLVEQNVAFALSVASRFFVMEKGRVVASGAVSDDDAETVIHRHLTL